MDDPTRSVKSTESIQRDMQQTREAITEKVAALENQVVGTIQTAADTVTHTVEAVKEAVTNTPAAVSETVKQTVDAVKQSWRDTIGSFSVSGCVQRNPWTALGTTMFAGFLLGWRTGPRGERESNFAGRHTGDRVPPEPRPEPRHEGSFNFAGQHVGERAERPPGLVGDLGCMVGKEVRELAEQALTTLMQSLKQSIGTRVPEVVDAAMHRVADQIQPTPRSRTRVSMNGS